jgi:monoamine oxidase
MCTSSGSRNLSSTRSGATAPATIRVQVERPGPASKHSSPAHAALRDDLLQQVPAGSVITFQVGCDSPFWRRDGLSGFVLSLDDEVNVVFDNSPPDASCGVVVGAAAEILDSTRP